MIFSTVYWLFVFCERSISIFYPFIYAGFLQFYSSFSKRMLSVYFMLALVFQCCYYKFPQTQCCETTQIYYSSVDQKFNMGLTELKIKVGLCSFGSYFFFLVIERSPHFLAHEPPFSICKAGYVASLTILLSSYLPLALFCLPLSLLRML